MRSITQEEHAENVGCNEMNSKMLLLPISCTKLICRNCFVVPCLLPVGMGYGPTNRQKYGQNSSMAKNTVMAILTLKNRPMHVGWCTGYIMKEKADFRGSCIRVCIWVQHMWAYWFCMYITCPVYPEQQAHPESKLCTVA